MVAERRFFVRPAAETEIAGAIACYRSKHPGLEVAFVEEIDRVFAEIREAPERWPLWRQDRPLSATPPLAVPVRGPLKGYRCLRASRGRRPRGPATGLLACPLSHLYRADGYSDGLGSLRQLNATRVPTESNPACPLA